VYERKGAGDCLKAKGVNVRGVKKLPYSRKCQNAVKKQRNKILRRAFRGEGTFWGGDLKKGAQNRNLYEN